MTDQTRRQIQNHTDAINTIKLIKAVQNHVLDGADLSQSQLTGAEMLLKRTVPSLTSVEQTVTMQGKITIAVKLGD